MEPASKPHFLFGKLFLLGIMAIGMIIGSVFWLTARIDRMERENGEKLVQLMVTERVDKLRASVADYSYWDSAFEYLDQGQRQEIDDEIGTAAAEGGIFSHILVLDPERGTQYLYGENGPLEDFDLALLEPFLTHLRLTTASEKVTISGIGRFNDRYGAVAVAYITPTYLDTLGDRQLPIFIGIKMFTSDALQAIVHLTHGTGYAIAPVDAVSQGPNVPLIGPDGMPVADLVWTPGKAGTVLRSEIMPGILIVCAGIFGICLSAAGYFHRQGKALAVAVAVATTDRLTGLLNRAGLEEVLRRPATDAMLAAGKIAVLYIDLNNFKKLNDLHGHKAGDQALKLFARRLRDSVRSKDHVVRLGGDEFICVILDEMPLVAARTVSERLLLSCAMSMKLGNADISLPPAMGIAVANPDETWETLLANADAAMFHAKRRGQRTAVIFGESIEPEPQESRKQVSRRS